MAAGADAMTSDAYRLLGGIAVTVVVGLLAWKASGWVRHQWQYGTTTTPEERHRRREQKVVPTETQFDVLDHIAALPAPVTVNDLTGRGVDRTEAATALGRLHTSGYITLHDEGGWQLTDLGRQATNGTL